MEKKNMHETSHEEWFGENKTFQIPVPMHRYICTAWHNWKFHARKFQHENFPKNISGQFLPTRHGVIVPVWTIEGGMLVWKVYLKKVWIYNHCVSGVKLSKKTCSTYFVSLIENIWLLILYILTSDVWFSTLCMTFRKFSHPLVTHFTICRGVLSVGVCVSFPTLHMTGDHNTTASSHH